MQCHTASKVFIASLRDITVSMSAINVRHDSFCVRHYLFYAWHATPSTSISPPCVTWLILCVLCMRDMTRPTCDMTYSRCDIQHHWGDTASTSLSPPCATFLFLCVPWMCAMTHSTCDMTNCRCDMQHYWGDIASTSVLAYLRDTNHCVCAMHAWHDSVYMWHDFYYVRHATPGRRYCINVFIASLRDMNHCVRSLHAWHYSFCVWHDSF